MKNLVTKIGLMLCLLTLLAGVASAQPEMSFANKDHEFGTVHEGEIASHEFEFTNTGNQPLIIDNVRASCGCTTPYWPRDPIAPGQTAKIKASYNSQGRPGPFNKSIMITSNAKVQRHILYIKGLVEKKPEKQLTAEELAAAPKIRMDVSSKNFGKLERGQTAKTRVTIKNDGGKEPLTIKGITSNCHCVRFELDKPTLSIPAGQQAEITFTYAPRRLGKNVDAVYIQTNDPNTRNQKLMFMAEVVTNLQSQSVIRENKTAVPFK